MSDKFDKWLQEALNAGFDYAVSVNVSALTPMQAVRDMCAEDKCRAYGHNWTCPPQCGTLEECAREIQKYKHGMLLQTVGNLKKEIDTRGYMEAEKRHNGALTKLAGVIRREYPDALCLGAGGCRVCTSCAYPAPCRFPQLAYSSMEAYGLFVTKVCKDHGASYYHGPRTITYSACVLF